MWWVICWLPLYCFVTLIYYRTDFRSDNKIKNVLCPLRSGKYPSEGRVRAVCELLRTEKDKSKQLQTKKLGGYIFYV